MIFEEQKYKTITYPDFDFYNYIFSAIKFKYWLVCN